MRKIPTIFMNDKDSCGHVYDKINPSCQWVFDRDENDLYVGGVIRKYDGFCCMIESGVMWRRSVINNSINTPAIWRLIQLDGVNNSIVLWEPIDNNDTDYDIFITALSRLHTPDDGTYELIGPGINANPENVDSVRLMRHDHAPSILLVNRSFSTIKRLLENTDVYGYVFTHPDGRKAKINRTHFGFDRLIRGPQ